MGLNRTKFKAPILQKFPTLEYVAEKIRVSKYKILE